MSEETWKPVPGYEGSYDVSDHGNVRSLRRGGKLLFRRRNKNGYVIVTLCVGGDPKQLSLSRMVLITFLGINPEKPQANHLDGNKSNNRLDNLEWVTARENSLHSIHVLGHGIGENHPLCKIPDADIEPIRNEYAAGEATLWGIAGRYEASATTIWAIVHRKGRFSK